MRLGPAEVDVGADRVQRHAALHDGLAARHLGAAQASGHHRLAAQRAARHGALDVCLQRAPKRDAPLELVGDVARDELRVQLRHADLLDVHAHALAGERLELRAQLVDLLAAAADHDARLRGVDRDRDDVRVALDLNSRDAGVPHRPFAGSLRIARSPFSSAR